MHASLVLLHSSVMKGSNKVLLSSHFIHTLILVNELPVVKLWDLKITRLDIYLWSIDLVDVLSVIQTLALLPMMQNDYSHLVAHFQEEKFSNGVRLPQSPCGISEHGSRMHKATREQK